MQAIIKTKYKSSYILSRIIIKSATNSIEIPHFAYLHSTAPSFEKWKPKWNNSDARQCEQPTKNYIRFATRQKRADAKNALKDTLFINGSSNISSEGLDLRYKPFLEMNKRGEEEEGDHSNRKLRTKASVRRDSRGMKAKRHLKQRREKAFEQFAANPNIFQATYWGEGSQWGRRKLNESDLESESDSEPCNGEDSDRLVLGLPAKGPLKIDDVKNAFRLAALKWHPDRHQGPSQASAEEKFKRCVDAYESLSDVLPTS